MPFIPENPSSSQTERSPLGASRGTKRNVLFVDDERNDLYGYERAYGSTRPDFNLFLANSGAEALDILSKNKIDVIVADLYMPEMDGAELIQIVAEKHPKTVRMITAEHSDHEKVLRSAATTHQLVHKPCDYDLLRLLIDRACQLRDVIENDMLKELIAGITNIPSLPELYLQLEKEIQSPKCSIQQVGDIVAQDAPMTAKILKFSNSAFFGLRFQVTSTKEAAIFLGLDNLKALVLSAQIFSKLEIDSSMSESSSEEMWWHSLMVASLAREIVQSEFDDVKMAKDAFVAGILHDLGKLILLQVPEQYAKVKKAVAQKKCSWLEAEYSVLKASHAEVGAYLLGLWAIPDEIIEIVAFHHDPLKLGSNKFEAISAVHVANALLREKNLSADPKENPYLDMNYIESIGATSKLAAWTQLADKIQKPK
jgi:putative nucleotidyltransferase with HDIG domain